MSHPNLPDDPARWPKDPYQLLSVQYGIDPRELRRVYTQLIRQYKPEQCPEQFRRIRDAYETVLRQVEFYRPTADADDAPPAPEPAPQAEGNLPAWNAAAPTLDEAADALWQRACAGEEAAAYRALTELHDQRPGHVGLCLRLYWLLTLTPGLDERRAPCDWLVQGLQANGFSGTLRELYRREIADQPAEAQQPRCAALLRLPWAAGQLADLAEWRWSAAARLGVWNLVDDDLELLHGRLALDEQETWLRLLICAAEQLAAVGSDPAFTLAQECLKQIGFYEHMHGPLADSLDRLEFHLRVGEGLRLLRKEQAVSEPLLRLVALSWSRPFEEVRAAAWPVLERMTRDPRAALAELDRMYRFSLGQPVLTQFGFVLSMVQGSLPDWPEDPRSPAQRGALVDAFQDDHTTDYAVTRPALLRFCLDEALSAEDVAECAAGTWLGQEIMRDWPLRYVVLGCRLFWM